MLVGYKELHNFIDSKTSVQILRLAFATLNCKNYPCKSENKYVRIKRFDINEALEKIEEKIKGMSLMDIRFRESREKYRDILIEIRDNKCE